MSVARSVAATAASRLYLTVVGLVVLPLYLRLMGAEGYGLVALFFVLQVWFQLLDLGLCATFAREVARFRGGALDGERVALLLRALEKLFIVLLGGVVAVLFVASDALARRWLNLDQLTPSDASLAIELMAAGVAARVLGELYRAAVIGFERLVWIAGCNILFGTLRLLGVLPVLVWAGPSPLAFFGYQLAVAMLETATLAWKARRLLPLAPRPVALAGSAGVVAAVRPVLAFSLSMSLASVVWVLASQVDKLLLSGMLSLAEYGAFSLTASAAAAVLLATGSLADALIPRFNRLRAQDAGGSLRETYRQATQGTVILGASAAAVLALHAERVLWVWTGNAALAGQMAPVLALYAAGNAALAVAAMPYYLQLAQGRLGLHLVGTGIMAALLVPGLVWATARHGAVGAGAVWLAVNAAYLIAWTPIAHRRFASGSHGAWLWRDVLPIALSAVVAGVVTLSLPWPTGRAASALQLLVVAGAILAAAAAGSSWARGALRQRWRGPAAPGPDSRIG